MTTPLLMLSYEAPPRLSAESILVGKTLKALVAVALTKSAIDLVCAAPGDEASTDKMLESLLPKTLRIHRFEPLPKGRKTILQRILGGKGGWQKAAVNKSLALFPAEHKKPTLIYSRSHPPVSHLAALDLVAGAFKGVPWVAHFSDPWSQHAYYKSAMTRIALARLERQVFNAATRLIFVSEALRETMLAKESDAVRAKSRVVPHCFDASLYSKAPLPATLPTEKPGTRVIAHVGDLYGLRSPATLFEAMSGLFKAQPQLPEFSTTTTVPQASRLPFVHETPHLSEQAGETPAVRENDRYSIRLWLTGRFDPQFVGLDQAAEIAACVRYCPPVPYLQSLTVMAAADVLLTIEAPMRHSVFFPSKLVDYLGARKPLLAITPEGSLTSRLMEQWRQPWCDARDSVGLTALLQRIATGQLWPPPAETFLDAYSALTVGKQLAAILTEAMKDEG
ncbi:MAG: glycosyltransferase [Planctomycetota bacterium]